MGEANVVSFDRAMRMRSAEEPPRHVTEVELRARQESVPLEDCHVALHRISCEITTKTKRFALFNDLSAAFPKGRHIVVLGHKGSGKSVLFELMLRERSPTRGDVLGASRLSWPVHSVGFLDQRLSVRQNTIFVSRILGMSASKLMYSVQRFCDLSDRQLNEKTKAIPGPARRRMGIVFLLAADFDCHMIDSALKAGQFGLEGADADAFEAAILGRDYIFAVSNPKQIPSNADLAYILYDGRLYYFDDIVQAVEIFEALPEPLDPGGSRGKRDEDDDDDAPVSEEGF